MSLSLNRFWNRSGRSSRKARPAPQKQFRRAFLESLEERRVLTAVTIPGGASSNWLFSDADITSNGLPVGGSSTSGLDGSGAAIDDGEIGLQGDAVDFAAMVWVNNTQVGGAVTANAPNVSFAPSVIAGLNVNYSYYIAANSATVRALLTLNNPTASDITVPIDYASNFGSDNTTVTSATSSGDTTFTNADRWIVTDDFLPDTGDPANTTVLFGPFAPAVTPASVSQTVFDSSGTQGVLARYTVTVPAGQTRSLMFFHKLNTTSALATSEAPTFFDSDPAADLVSGLSSFQLARIVNWDFVNGIVAPVADSGGLYSVNEGGSVVVSGANSSYPSGTITNYEWDLDNNGTYETTGVSPTFSAAGIDGPTTRTVGLRVTSSDGEFAFDTATIHINNAAPSLLLALNSGVIQENGSTTLSGTITDPSGTDTFTLNLNWGDPLSPNNVQTFTLGTTGLSVAANGIDWQPGLRIFSLPHQYLDDNPSATPNDLYSITATVADDDSLPRVLFVSDSDTDFTIPAALGSGYDITIVTQDFANGNAALLADLSSYAAVVWSSTGDGFGGIAPPAVITNLTNYVTAGGNVFVTGYDSAASPVDTNLITFVGGTNVTDSGALPTAVANLATSLTTGLVDIRNVVPGNQFGDQDALSGLGPDTVGIVSSTDGFQWTLRTIGDGEIAYVSNGTFSGGTFDNWLVTAPLADATYNASVRNFVSAAATTNPPALSTTETLFVQVNNVAPVAAPKFAVTNENSTIVPFNVLSGFSDVGTLDTHSVVPINSQSALGGNYFFTAVGLFAYSPNGQFEALPLGSSAVDTIPYTIVDDDGGTSTSSVAVTVNGLNDAPIATDDSYTVAEDNTLTVAATGVLGNDNDVDTGAILSAVLVTGPSHASAFTFNLDGSFTYVPNPNYNGPDSFTYKTNDGLEDSNTVTVSLTVTSVVDFDFGDAPASYGVAQHSEGAGFIGGPANTGPLFGTRDFETNNQASANANGDDLVGSDDEEGITFGSATLAPRLTSTVAFNATAAGKLDAWIDYNRNGTFEASERIADGLTVAPGANGLIFTVPDTAVTGPSFARFRISTAGSATATGLAADGEVEDYAVTIANPPAGSSQIAGRTLVISGTNSHDAILVRQLGTNPATARVSVIVAPFGQTGNFALSAIDDIVIFGLAGNDAITVAIPLTKPVTAYGDAGNDAIIGGGGNDYLDGGAGIDTILGGAGHDILLGGVGADTDVLSGDAGRDLILGGGGIDNVNGGLDDDIVIGGNLANSTRANLQNILALWTANAPFNARITSLNGLINNTTVQNDGVSDYVFGSVGRDWLLDYALRDFFFDLNLNPTNGDKLNSI